MHNTIHISQEYRCNIDESVKLHRFRIKNHGSLFPSMACDLFVRKTKTSFQAYVVFFEESIDAVCLHTCICSKVKRKKKGNFPNSAAVPNFFPREFPSSALLSRRPPFRILIWIQISSHKKVNLPRQGFYFSSLLHDFCKILPIHLTFLEDSCKIYTIKHDLKMAFGKCQIPKWT